ncbi:transporter [Ganoderma sinense ZZ0214-1]|uniref:Transporter n=1 Tax=Ganoderma sinense ZZ0214-1 TaxID=1077348 RepID=A0A2G8S7C8_9APHY|nr:transporter [Ganoderma sinense ZZ0214-1]
MQSEDDRMMTDDGAQTQQQTQSTQQASQADFTDNTHLWGYLIPCSANLRRIDFQKIKPSYSIGRNREGTKNDIIFPGMKISNFHCVIEWDKNETPSSAIKVTDLSSNGTFINGEKIGKHKVKILRDGNEIAFGTALSQHHLHGGLEDYRFIYRHMACGPATRGLHKHYDVQHELGKGSFATVMKALHRAEDKWYAVKMIHASHLRRNLNSLSESEAKPEDKKGTLAREISILERLQHRNICQLKEVFFEPYSISLVLEWAPGGDLLDYIIKRNGLGEPETKYLTYQICDALAYVHALGIAHRDLKPENVLLTDDKPPVVKVADFGLAKVIDSMTMLRTMCGTPAYLAPEVVNQVPGQEGYNQSVDSWSVGVIVFAMLTMSTPFGDEDMEQDVKTRVSTRKIQWSYLREFNTTPASKDFICGLLDFNPKSRMTLTDACQHEWLAAERINALAMLPPPPPSPAMPTIPGNIASPMPSLADASMRSVVSHTNGMALDDNEDEDAAMETGRTTPPYVPPPQEDGPSQSQSLTAAVNRQPSRLVRRSDIVARAREGGDALPSPSQEMRDRAVREDEEEDENLPTPTATTNGNNRANGRVNNKRKAALDFDGSLTPMSEEDETPEADEPADAPTPRTGAPARQTRRGRGGGAAKKAVAPPVTRRGRGRGSAVAEEAEGPRRSSRLIQAASPAKAPKVARRA